MEASDIQLNGIETGIKGVSSTVQSKGDQVQNVLKGLENTEKESLEQLFKKLKSSLGDFQKIIIDSINSNFAEDRKAQKAAQESLDKSNFSFFGNDAKDNSVKSKKNPTTSDVMKLSGKYSLGPLLLYSELELIRKDLLKMMPDKKGGGSKKNVIDAGLSAKESIISNVKGIPQMVGTLKEFAKTMIIFRLFNSKIANAGMDIFANILKRWNGLTNKYKSDLPRWQDFTKIVSEMVLTLKSYFTAVIFLALSFPFSIIAIPAALAMVALFSILSLTTKLLKPLITGGLKDFAMACILMAGSFLLFSFAMIVLAKWVVPNLIPASLGLAVIALVISATSRLGGLAKKNAKNFIDFAIGCAIMGGAYAAFGVAMLILGQLGLKIFPASLGLAAISLVISDTSIMASKMKKNVSNFIKFAAGAVILASAYLLFGIAMHTLTILGKHPIPVLAGLAIISGLIVGSVFLSKLIKKNMTDFRNFCAGAALLGLAFIGFSISMRILAGLSKGWVNVALGLALISLVIFGATFLAKKVEECTQDFILFCAGVAILSVAFILFGVSMKILSTIGLGMAAAILGIITIAAVVYGTAMLSKEISNNMKDFLMFAVGCVILGVAYMVFGGAMGIIGKVAKNAPLAIIGILLCAGVLLGTIAMAQLVKTGMMDFLIFAAGCLILGLAYMALGAALLIMAKVTENVGKVLIGLVIAFVVIGISIALGNALLYASPLLAIFAGLCLLLGAGYAALGGALLLLGKVGEIPKEKINGALTNTALVFISMAKLLLPALGSLVTLSLLLPASILLLGVTAPLSSALKEIQKCAEADTSVVTLGMNNITTLFKGIKDIKPFAKDAKSGAKAIRSVNEYLKDGFTGIVTGIQGIETIGHLNFVEIIKGLAAIKLTFAIISSMNLIKSWIKIKALKSFSKDFNESISSLYSPLRKCVDITNDMAIASERAVEFFQSSKMDAFLIGTAKLGQGIRNFGISLSGLGNIARFNMFVASINKLTQAESAIDKLNQFAQNADAFNSIADSFSRMADSFETMSDKERKVRSLFDTLSKAKVEMNTLTESTPQVMGGATMNPDVTKILNRLNEWDIKGVPIRASIDGQHNKITPNEVGNSTGLKVRTR